MTSEPPRVLRARERVLELGHKTYIMAILNLTNDSFSGDGVGSDVEEAVRRSARAQTDGADIIDVGGESARADTAIRAADEEASQIAETIRLISAETDLVISVDTYKGVVAEAAMQAGAHMINDIGGFMNDTSTADIAARYSAALVMNYTYERPKVRPAEPPQYHDLIGQHLVFLRDRVAIAGGRGVGAESAAIDPGIAFGKSHAEDIEVLRRLDEFTALGLPILVAGSRKHFIGSATGLAPADRDEATAAVTALSVARGADIVRVHNVVANVRAARMADAIVRGRPGDLAPTRASWPWSSGAAPVEGTTISPD